MKTLFYFSVFILTNLPEIQCQVFQENYKNRHDTILTGGSVYLGLNAASWFYNNEFFNPYFKGYTLIGAELNPTLIYQVNSKLQLSGGVNAFRYYAKNKSTVFNPLFSILYKPSESLAILMGSFNGGENHKLDEVIFSFENHLIKLVENGILIRYNSRVFQNENWLDWQQFILPGDTFQEQFTVGSTGRLNFFTSGPLNISIPVTLLAHHSGGQVNDNNEEIETLINLSEGLIISGKPKINKDLTLFASFSLFQSLADFNPSPGQAFYVKTGIRYGQLELNAGYFNGKDFQSFTGNPLFNSRSENPDPLLPWLYGGKLEIVSLKAGIKQKTGDNSFLFFRFEPYYLLNYKKLDYSYSIHFQINNIIHLAKVPSGR